MLLLDMVVRLLLAQAGQVDLNRKLLDMVDRLLLAQAGQVDMSRWLLPLVVRLLGQVESGGAVGQGGGQGGVEDITMGMMSLALRNLTEQSAVLLHAKREVDVQAKVGAHSNPMSKHAVEHDLCLLDCIEDLQNFLMVNGVALVVTPNNIQQVSQAIMVVLAMTQTMKDKIHANSDKHSHRVETHQWT
jgi:hypothetical protein